MSLWTPGGEHPVERNRPTDGPAEAPAGGPAAAAPGDAGGPGGDPFAGMTPEQRAEAEQMLAEMSEVQQQLAAAPAAAVVANHAMGLYELAAIHLTSQPPKLDEAKIAIDAFAALLEVIKGKLGPDEVTLSDALHQLRLGFVQLTAAHGPTDADSGDATGAGE